MSIQLAYNGAEYNVALLEDLVPGSSEIKVMATGTMALDVPAGAVVELQNDDAVAGTYTIKMALAPAAPRNWRAYLSATTVVEPGSSSLFSITYAASAGTAVRQTMQTIKVPMSRLNTEYARISRMGGKIISVKPL